MPASLKRLEGFHVKATRCMTGLLAKMTGGSWRHPKMKTELVVTGLHTIKNYAMRWVID